jgi:hypothetical protein
MREGREGTWCGAGLCGTRCWAFSTGKRRFQYARGAAPACPPTSYPSPLRGRGAGGEGALHPQRPMRTGRRTAPQNRTRAVAIPGVFFTSPGRRRGVLTEPEAFLKRATYNRLSATSHNREGDCRQPGPTSSRRPQAGDSPPLGSGFDRSPADGISHSAQLWPSRHIRSPCPQTSKI